MTAGLPDLAGLENIAPGKPATQSSLSPWSRRNDAAGGVNGPRTGRFGFHTGREPEPWWQLDLLEEVPARFVVLWNREDAGQDRVRHLVVETSQDGETWSVLHETGESVFGGVASGTPLAIACDEEPFRFLRLRRTKPGYLHLDKVEVYVPASAELLATRAILAQLGEDALDPGFLARDGLWLRWPGSDDAPGRPRSLSLQRIGRFGNGFIQLMRAIHVARRLDVGRIHLGQVNPAGLRAARRIGGIEFAPGRTDGRDGPDLQGRFFFQQALPKSYATLDGAAMTAIAETYLRPMFDGFFEEPPPPAVPTLHIHIRSGDIFVNPHAHYPQPPLAFYRLAVRHAVAEHGVERVVIVHEDEANPCIGALRDWLGTQGIACVSQSASVRADLGALMTAEHLVVSRGTFAVPVMLLSSRLRTVYGFRRDAVTVINQFPGAVLLAHRGIRLLNVEDAAGRFTAEDGWRHTPAQRALMLDYPEEALRLVEAEAPAA